MTESNVSLQEMQEIEPCPFCGGEAAYQTDTEEADFSEEWIGCLECGATTAVEVWNRRVPALALRTPSDGEVVDEAETWCRLAGKAMDALDTLSNWEVESDDEDAAGLMADFAEKATAEIRASYPARLSTLTGKE